MTKTPEFRSLQLQILLTNGVKVTVLGCLDPKTRGYTMAIDPPTLRKAEAVQAVAAVQGVLGLLIEYGRYKSQS